jgi:hypothetical protein
MREGGRVCPAKSYGWQANSLTLNQRKHHEISHPLSKPVALPQGLQTKSYPPNQTGNEVELRFSPGALRIETTNQIV